MGENKELELAKKTFQATEIIPEERYQALLDEIHTIQGETIKLARDAVIQYKYKMGEAIVVELTRDNLQEYGIIITRLSKDLKISESELYRCVEFKTKYPDLEKALELFPEGENISWDKIKTQYLPEGGLARLSLAFPQMESLDK